MALEHSTAVPLLMGGALLVAGMIFLSRRSSAHHAEITARRRRAQAGVAWERFRQDTQGGDAVSELLIALSHCLLMRAGLTPEPHTISPYLPDYFGQENTDHASLRWEWSMQPHRWRDDHTVLDVAWFFDDGGLSSMIHSLVGSTPLHCPPWLEEAIRARSHVDGVQVAYGTQHLRIRARKGTPSAHAVLDAQARLRRLLPEGVEVDAALDGLGQNSDGGHASP